MLHLSLHQDQKGASQYIQSRKAKIIPQKLTWYKLIGVLVEMALKLVADEL